MPSPIPLSVLNDRPPEPCLGSGHCCSKALCALGVQRHGLRPGPCPSLVKDEAADRHFCGEILKLAGEERKQLEDDLGIGAGCCANMNQARSELARRLPGWTVGAPCEILHWIDRYEATVSELDESGRPTRVRLLNGWEISLDQSGVRFMGGPGGVPPTAAPPGPVCP